MDPLVALRDHEPHPEQRGPFAAQSRLDPLPYSLPARSDERRPLVAVPLGRVEDRQRPRRSAGACVHEPSVPGASSLRSRMFANVPRIITSWFPRRAPYELNSRRRRPRAPWRYRPAGESALIEPAGEMWSVVIESPTRHQDPSALDVLDRPRRHRVVGRTAAPARRSTPGPTRTPVRPGSGATSTARRRPRCGRTRARTAPRRSPPPSTRRPRRASARCLGGTRARRPRRPSGSLVRSRSIRAGQRVGDAERRRCQVARPNLRVDPSLEVPVAGEHGDDVQVALVDRRRDALGQRTGVPDAGRAAVPDEGEPELRRGRA